jgi:hypothetical protein
MNVFRSILFACLASYFCITQAQEIRIETDKEYSLVFTLQPTAIDQIQCQWPQSLKEQRELFLKFASDSFVTINLKGTAQTNGFVNNVSEYNYGHQRADTIGEEFVSKAAEVFQKFKCPSLASAVEIVQEFAIFLNSKIIIPTHRSERIRTSTRFPTSAEIIERLKNCKPPNEPPQFPLMGAQEDISGLVEVTGLINYSGTIGTAVISRSIGMTIQQAQTLFSDQVITNFIKTKCEKSLSDSAFYFKLPYVFRLLQ